MRTDEALPVEQVELPQEAPAKAKKPNLKTQLADMTERAEAAEARVAELSPPDGELLSWKERAELAEQRNAELEAGLLDLEARLAQVPAKKISAPKGQGGSGPSVKYEVFGCSVTSVCRWMGRDGFTVEQAKRAIDAQGIACSPATIGIQVKAGAKGERGAPAELSDEQAETLRAFKV